MKRQLMKTLSMMLVLVFVMGTYAIPVIADEVPTCQPPWSAEEPEEPERVVFADACETFYYPKDKKANIFTLDFDNEDEACTLVSLKVSNKKVISVSKVYEKGTSTIKHFKIKVKKVGDAAIKFKWKQGGKTYSHKFQVFVKKYDNPLKSIKIGKTSFTSKVTKCNEVNLKRKTYKGKVALKTNKGWKIKSISIDDVNTYKTKKIKNNKSIKLKKGQVLSVECRNKKTGQWTTVYLDNGYW